MTFYMCTIVLTELLMLTMALHVARYSGFTRDRKDRYTGPHIKEARLRTMLQECHDKGRSIPDHI